MVAESQEKGELHEQVVAFTLPVVLLMLVQLISQVAIVAFQTAFPVQAHEPFVKGAAGSALVTVVQSTVQF